MLVEIPLGTVVGPHQGFGSDPIAEVHIVARGERVFRETGIEFPGLVGLPVWDGNPEVLEMDLDRLGLGNSIVTAGSTFNATGALGFEFGGYELFPKEFTISGATLVVPVRDREPGEFTVGSLNLFRLFDTDSDFALRLNKFSRYIREVLKSPDLLAVQEASDIVTLQTLTAKIFMDGPTVNYTAYLVEGNDVGGIDVGFLVRESVLVDGVTQLGAAETFIDPSDGSVDILHDRPPLLLEGRFIGNGVDFPFSVMAIHNRSFSGIDSPSDGPRVRAKRLAQAQSIATHVQCLQLADPDTRPCSDDDGPDDMDSSPPVADAGLDQDVECVLDPSTQFTLDGSGSSDPDGGPLTFSWSGPFGVAVGATPTVALPLGVHTITLTVTDQDLELGVDEVVITVQDTLPGDR